MDNEKMIFTETLYYLRRKNGQHIIMTLKKVSIKDISTKIMISNYDESWDQEFDGTNIINQKDGEVVLQYDRDNITYISNDYQIIMETNQFEGDERNLEFVLNRR